MGTCVAFLDFTINWVNNPALEHGLILFRQAGTGKLLIMHEMARLFDNMHCLTSSFIFIRRDNPLELRRLITSSQLLLTISQTTILCLKLCLKRS